MWLVIIIIIAVVIWAYSSSKQSEREREEARKKSERIAHIKKDYPNAYNEFWGKPVNLSQYGYQYSAYVYNHADEKLSDSMWEMLEKRALAWKESRIQTEKNKKADLDWESAQTSFANKMRSIAPEKLPSCGHYTYTVGVKTKVGSQLNMKIWQHFVNEACLEKDLDYTYNQLTLSNTNKLPQWKEKGVFLNETLKQQILDLITLLASEKKVVVFYNEVIEGWNLNALCSTYMVMKTPESVKKINVAAIRSLGITSKSGTELLAEESPECVVVIDAFTNNDQLKKNCAYIFNALQDKRPVIAYISLIKTYDRQEMIEYITRSKTEAEKRAAEERAKEEERKKREAEELAAQKKKEEERDNLKKEMQATVASNKKDWVRLNDDFYCTGFLNTRNLLDSITIKNFRNESDDFLNHERALCPVIPQIKERLIDTFGEGNLKTLTLFCVPASTNVKNDIRYEDFPKRLCDETGMGNAFNHVRIVQDGMSKKDPRNTTGRSIQPVIEYDKDYFKDRNILLFDDVVISGDTMLGYKDIIEKMGATVMAGISLGKPKYRISTSLVSAEAKVRLQGTAKNVLINNVKDWEHLYGGFYYTWLFYYYPTTCDFEASESEWLNRHLVWNFKNDPDKNISSIQHEEALDNVIPQIRQRLCDSFGEEYLQFLTLVCLPASTKIKNTARYDEFSNRLCEETGMENAYEHVHIVQDGMSKKDPRNATGRSIQPVIEYDAGYFKGKYVLLFDDVVTKGETMLRYKKAMEDLGAVVIGGMCLGKTKHERPVQSGQYPNEYDEELPF